MWLDSKAVNCPQKWGNFRGAIEANTGKPLVWCGALPVGGEGKDLGS